MTDIDALIAETRDWLNFVEGSPIGGEKLAERLIDALTTEREKVAAREAEVERLRGALVALKALAEGMDALVESPEMRRAVMRHVNATIAKAEGSQ